MMTAFDTLNERIEAGEPLPAEEIRALAQSPDILQLGMLADAARRRRHGTRATYLRVASCRFDASFAEAVGPAAREVRVTGAPESLDEAVAAIAAARSIAGERTVSGFSWTDVARLAGDDPAPALRRFRGAGLDAVAALPLDAMDDPRRALRTLVDAGFECLRLSISKIAAAERTDLFLLAAELQSETGQVQAIDPLPYTLNAFRPTTGYEDVKMVALARLAAPLIPSIQVDWERYGPKLAQVALTFGADDIYGVSASDEAPEGRRRAPLEEIRRNIEAAGFQPVERDGRFVPLA